MTAHPEVELVSVTGRSAAGQPLGKVFPHLEPLGLEIKSELDDVDLVFSALPHRESAEQLLPLVNKGVKVIDISADFRLKDAVLYSEWYGFQHPDPASLSGAVYGLPELYRESIKSAGLVANPGCYPTASILALAPALKAGLVSGNIIVDAKSGLSGAGRSLNLRSHYCEANEDTAAYSIAAHRHQPEIAQEVKNLSDTAGAVVFTPHLVPMTRGILASCYTQLDSSVSIEDLFEIYVNFYKDEPFVRVTGTPPHTRDTAGTNLCLVHPVIDKRSGTLIVIAAIDNLVKGAAGQAVQNMNLVLGLEETTALPVIPQYP